MREVARAVLAAPIAHYYSLLATARAYHRDDLPEGVARFSVHPLYEDALSDQIPSERAHEIWSRASAPRYWQDQLGILAETVQRRLGALNAVTRRLRDDLAPTLSQTAPRINIAPPRRQTRVSADGQLWYAYAKLNAALDELEAEQIRAMPPHEREARFHSARLPRRLTGADERAARGRLDVQNQNRQRAETRDRSLLVARRVWVELAAVFWTLTESLLFGD